MGPPTLVVVGAVMTRALVQGPRPTTTLEALPKAYWSQMHRVCWPGRPDLLIDHVLVGPSGIYVVRYLPAELDETGAAPGHDRRGLHGVGAAACVEYADIVTGLLPPRYRDRGRPVLCLRGGVERAEDLDGVQVTTLGALGHIVRSSTPVLSTSEVRQAFALLRANLVDVPLEAGPSRRRLRAALRMAAAPVAVAAASVGVLMLGPETMTLFATRS